MLLLEKVPDQRNSGKSGRRSGGIRAARQYSAIPRLWIVERSVVGKPLIVGRKEFAKLFDVAPTSVSDRWVPRGLLKYEDAAIVSGKPYWPGGLAAAFQTPTGRATLNESVLAQLMEAQGATTKPRTKEDLPALVGYQEYAALFDVTQKHIAVAMDKQSEILAPVDYVMEGPGASKLWLLDTVLGYVETTLKLTRQDRWVLQEDVAEALGGKVYGGPGSKIVARGAKAQASKG
ncbi:hypothetical protein ACQEVX_05355 [Streptomyces syringium]|uniref:hypothetical protein n=1 Tax=Streptomyces syringium TaxID=76729 RepID=UPI003D8F84A0